MNKNISQGFLNVFVVQVEIPEVIGEIFIEIKVDNFGV